MTKPLLLKNLRLMGADAGDVLIEGGRIAQIAPEITPTGRSPLRIAAARWRCRASSMRTHISTRRSGACPGTRISRAKACNR